MEMLSANFSELDLTRSATATRLGIDNAPSSSMVLGNLRAVAVHILEPVAARYGRGTLTIHSGFRCKKLNDAIRGARNSQHMAGQAVDYTVARVKNADLAEWCRRNLDFDQIILEFCSPSDPYAGWVHCSYADPGRRKFMTARAGINGQTIYAAA
ncbi:Peptidase M15A, C-terminal [uncultured Caudovirales phage]|uniref:Peptidase M15A, C-terminal n=1 Tax=uncultured Caudovirales phage TaxID=2100421 RepID=A0A6J5LBE7_9CAUD|nr:Peptidase M15A, C-terminal [uncultured Caudovirales phage]